MYAINYAPSALKHFAGETKGTTRPRVNLSHIRELPIPLPPLEEQRRIVEKLEALFSELDSAVQSLEAALSKLKRYRQAVLKAAVEGELSREWREANQGQLEPASELLKRILAERRQRWEEAELAKMQAKGKIPQDDKWKARYVEPEGVDSRELPELPEGWVWTSLEQLGFISGGLTKNPKREKLETKLPYLRVANVYADELRLDDIELIGIETEELERTLLEPGDLLVVEGNGSPDQIGRVALWDGSVKPCVHQNHIIKVRLVEKSLNRWGLIFLLSLLGRQLIMSVASSTSGLYTLSLSKVASLRIVLPNIKEVSFIVQEVDRLLSEADKTEEAIRASLKRAERLRQAVLREAFSGRLVPQDPADEPAAVLLERIRAARQAEGGKKGSGKRKAQALLL
ncbi:Type-1 restriction enzyme EcoKI specificity protein [Meiothermus granaticius NBRC 107808]|uniref:Type-1 restriction enzyme EcoKI specificity protein n=1 Tax=Meiothermus granaticius NBRC 107808 TaxID=1227551 RepID=A0A399FAE7_9DEIN|nr:Type-1 restriction enzyme EcoKI specificity protein [Meiothermus granaticius NBRC 107808]